MQVCFIQGIRTGTGYNALDQPAFLNLGNGLTTRYGYYDPAYDPARASFHLRSIQTTGPGGDLQDLSYAYDPAGNLTGVWDLANQVTWSYEYDPLDRLSRAERSVGGLPQVYGYGYDLLNNLVAKSDPNADLSLTYPDPGQPRPHAPLQVWDGPSLRAEFTYNANGNRATKLENTGSITYTYDIENRLTQVVSDTGGSLLTTSFAYDGDGRRVKRSTSEGENRYYVNNTYETGDVTYNYVRISDIGNEFRPSATHADGLHVAWESTTPNNRLCYAHRISDTWSTPSLINTSGLYAWEPALAVYNGVLHVTWIGSSTSGGTSHAYYSHSTDGGLTWSAPVNLSVYPTSTVYDSGQPALAVDAAGTLHLVWAEQAYIICLDCIHIYYRTSTDGGQSWSGTTRLNNWTPTGLDSSVQPDVAVADNGDVAAVWRRAPGVSGPGDIYLRRRVGGTWQSPQMISEGDGQAGWPRIAVAGGASLHVVWFYGGVYDNGELHYRSWEGSAWSEISSISGQVEAGNPYGGFYDDPNHDIAVNGAGQVFVAWKTGGPDTALATRKGENWSPPQIIAENFYGTHLSLATDETDAPQVIQRASGGYIYHITSGASSNMTKHYYAGGQPLATRVDDVLYYTLPDPTGTSLVITKANGDEVGRVLYDGYGAVLTSTLPATLTTTLAGSGDVPDPDTGLVYLGAGRWYDPALGRPLQPNPVGGPPALPQALNRYAATPWGPPGVAEGVANNAFNWTPHIIGFVKSLSVELAGQASIATGYRYAGRAVIQVTASRSALARKIPGNLRQSFAEAVFAFTEGGRTFYARRGVFTLTGSNLGELGSRADDIVVSLREALPSRRPWAATIFLEELSIADPIPIYRTLDDFAVFKAFKTGIGFGLDALIGGGFQYLGDLRDPYVSRTSRLWRAGIAGTGGAIFGGTFGVIAVELGLCPETGGATCLAAAATIGGLIWTTVQPEAYRIFEQVTGISILSSRNLKPLE